MLYPVHTVDTTGLIWILFIFFGIVIGTIIQLIVLRIAMLFPPVKAMVRWIIETALR